MKHSIKGPLLAGVLALAIAATAVPSHALAGNLDLPPEVLSTPAVEPEPTIPSSRC